MLPYINGLSWSRKIPRPWRKGRPRRSLRPQRQLRPLREPGRLGKRRSSENSGPSKHPGSSKPPEHPTRGQSVQICPDPTNQRWQTQQVQRSPCQNAQSATTFRSYRPFKRPGKKAKLPTRTMEAFLDLYKGQGLSEEGRTIAVRNTVEIYTSKWAERYIWLDYRWSFLVGFWFERGLAV